MTRRFKWIAALAALATGPLSAQAQQRIEIFDAHLHYNQEPTPFYSLDQVREVFRRNGIIGIVATSRPNKGTHELVDAQVARAQSGAVHPALSRAQRHADLVQRSDDLRADQERIRARLLPRHRRIPHLRKVGGIGLGQEDGRFRRRAEPVLCMRIATKRRCSSCSVTIPKHGSSGRIPDFR